MAKIFEMTEKQWQIWLEWLNQLPPEIREVAGSFPPNVLYRIKITGERVYPKTYIKDGTIETIASAKYNLLPRELLIRVKQEDLEECDLPGIGEPVGLTGEEE